MAIPNWMFPRPDIVATHHLSSNPAAVQQAHLDRRQIVDKPGWQTKMNTLARLPELEQLGTSAVTLDLAQDWVEIGRPTDITAPRQRERMATLVSDAIQVMMPWRKGPFRLFDQPIDTEWRSGWKWERVERALIAACGGDTTDQPSLLQGRRVLDIGCGNGYYMLRAAAHDPELVLGIDPSPHFYLQFETLQKYVRRPELQYNLLGVEHLPMFSSAFDVALCLGILYHRPNPLQTLQDLMQTLRPGGWLILESQAIDGRAVCHGETEFEKLFPAETEPVTPRQAIPTSDATPEELAEQSAMYPWALFPEERYAKSRTVYFLPTPSCLLNWARRAGFVDVQLTSLTRTTFGEQQRTPHMTFESLPDFLDPQDSGKTVEGYPGPWRALVIARRPEN